MRVPVLCAALLVTACKSKDEPPPTAAAPKDKHARCEAIADEITRMGVMLAKGLVGGLSEGKAKIEGEEEAQLRAELAQAKGELVERCLQWPEEALDCFGAGALFQSEKCERILAEAMGEPVLPADVPAGPAPAWSIELPQPVRVLVGCDDGTVVAAIEPGRDDEIPEGAPPATLVAIHDGKERWRTPLVQAPWSIEPLDAETVLVVLPRELVAVAVADGTERWRASLPGDEEYDRGPRAILREGDTTTILDDARRFLRVDPSRCAKGRCIEVAGEVPEDPEAEVRLDLHGPTDLVRLGDGGMAVVVPDEHRITVLDAKYRPRVVVEARVALSWAVARDDELVVALDGEVVGLVPARCAAAGVLAPSTWPPPGKPDWLRDATVREGEWTPTPAECVRWRRPLAVAEASDAPVAGFADAMLVQAGGFLFALRPDAERWKTPTAGQSLPVKHGDVVAVLGDVGRDDTQLALTWISPTDGKHLARTEVALGKGKMFLFDSPTLTPAGPLVVAGYERELVAFARP